LKALDVIIVPNLARACAVKTGAYVLIPVADALRIALDAAPRQSPIMLTNSDGKPWSESGFQGAWGKATTRAGIRGLTFHDLRGTAVVILARAGCNEVEIYSITGHKPSDVQAILTTHYLPRDADVASNAIAKLNQYKAQKVDEKLPTALPTARKLGKAKTTKP
jgi:integrase